MNDGLSGATIGRATPTGEAGGMTTQAGMERDFDRIDALRRMIVRKTTNNGERVSAIGWLDTLVGELRALRTEVARIAGIAKMRERRIGNLTGHLRFIAEAGCERVRNGLPKCVASDDEDASAPCNPCIARIALVQPDTLASAPTGSEP